ncbi:MAG: hypothetical protein ACKVVP_12520 [Chloroflexota bacterium]
MELTPEDLIQALINPGAPLPAAWPSGAFGAFLLFMFPVGGGIPFGVIMARDAGISPLVTFALYAVSDVLGAILTEPYVMFFRWLGRHVSWVGRIGQRISRATGAAGLTEPGKRGPLGIALLSFTVSMTTGRAAAAAAGHGPVTGWALAILGDLGYFLVLMTSTLWLSWLLGDERTTVGIVLVAMWVVPMIIRKIRARNAPVPAPSVSAVSAAAVETAPEILPSTGSRRGGSRAKGRKRARFANGASR